LIEVEVALTAKSSDGYALREMFGVTVALAPAVRPLSILVLKAEPP